MDSVLISNLRKTFKIILVCTLNENKKQNAKPCMTPGMTVCNVFQTNWQINFLELSSLSHQTECKIDGDPGLAYKRTRSAFLVKPETLRAKFGHHTSHSILKTDIFSKH